MWFIEEHDGGMFYFDKLAAESKGNSHGAVYSLDVAVGSGTNQFAKDLEKPHKLLSLQLRA